jgi:hypothetical protein
VRRWLESPKLREERQHWFWPDSPSTLGQASFIIQKSEPERTRFMKHARSWGRFIVVVSLTLYGAGCSPQPAGGEASGSVQAAPLTITQIVVGQSAEGSPPGHPLLTPETAIVVSLTTTGMAKDNKVEGKLFSLADGKLQDSQVLVIKPGATDSTELVFKQPEKWEVGRYLVEIYLDGKMIEQRELDINEPPSPEQT